MTPAAIDTALRETLRDVLGLSPARAAALTADSGLFGAMPELDSMAVANLLTAIEDRFGLVIEDEDLGGALLETFGTLAAFIAGKTAA